MPNADYHKDFEAVADEHLRRLLQEARRDWDVRELEHAAELREKDAAIRRLEAEVRQLKKDARPRPVAVPVRRAGGS